jgi:NitT/TauT family transport system substrate-binding protein
MKSFNHSIATLLLILVVCLTACEPTTTPTQALTPITVQLQWTHQAQFAGMYAADQKGYYAAEGLDITFAEGGSQVDKLTPVLPSTGSGQATGTAQFGVAGADELILARSEGKPLRAIATIYRRSPVVFISLAEKGITRPQDFTGLTIRAPANTLPSLRAMTTQVGIAPDQYTIVDLPSDLTMFASGDVPVWSAYVNSFVITVQKAGYKINLIFPDDYGVHFYADTLFTTDDLITADPDLVLRFLRATFQGWTYAVEHSSEIGTMVVHYNPAADPALENDKMAASIALVNTGEDHIGWMRPEIWAGMEQTLSEQGVLTAPLDVTQVYTMQFLEEIYK